LCKSSISFSETFKIFLLALAVILSIDFSIFGERWAD